MPRSARAAPRNMLPPPTTAATCTPSFTAAMISVARWATTSGEMPRGSEPANSPPDSFSTTRCQLGCSTPAVPVIFGFSVLRLADLEPGEAGDGEVVLGEELLDRGLVVLHEYLLGEHGVLEVSVQPAVHDPRDGLLGLALFAGDLLGDPALLLHHVGGDVLAGGVQGAHGGDLLGQVRGDLAVLLVELDQHAQGRRQGRVTAVQVGLYVSALEAGEPAELELLLQARARLLDELLDGRARLGLSAQQGQPVGRLAVDGGLRDLCGRLLEQGGLGHEVGLAVQLDQHAFLGTAELRGDQAVGRGAGGPLARILDALDAEQLDRVLEVAIGLGERVLAVHHASAGLVPESLDVSGSEVRHVLVSRLYVCTSLLVLAGGGVACGLAGCCGLGG